ncbi:hypothetical protein AVEN_153148-1 [Araneus ventricosus]|uniref:Uncharacterized protein n=1 Tax=Araneus ventricosus TaxID=182803 RepID=A0A4Y2LBS1_ARAVE|nr:hypothetical protein AVEN_262819-1 [Araneus ventricosus]GBN12193.1 hypothetical protein AVEN_48077-1 [Araneus ventricosus]GBN12219.1 hypothetical protein AVEN_137030-1 [Araneus ventricosus]GBN12223.1 hypothetical protein AVEN_153148-1 [Araneus ventricosus]
MGWVTMKDLPPPCISNRDHLNDSRQGINTETEGGVLMSIVGLGATVPQEVRPVIGMEATQPTTFLYPPREPRTRLIIRRLLMHVLVVPHPGCHRMSKVANLAKQFDLEIDSYDINKLSDMAQLAIGEPTEMREQIATIKAFSSDTDPLESKRHLQA